MKKLLAFLIMTTLLIGSFNITSLADTITFSDVDASSASGIAIYKLVNAGVLNGKGDGKFDPKGSLKRAELCKMINLVFKYTTPDTVQFSDVKPTDWYANQVLIAKKAGYINGYGDNTFKGEYPVTREQFCKILCCVGNLYDIPNTTTVTDLISDWAKPYVNKVLGNMLMTAENGKFRATENITREEISVVLSRFVTVTPTTPIPTPSVPSIGGGTGGGNGGSSNNNSDTTKTYTVKFVTDIQGVNVAKQTVKKGEKATKPSDPVANNMKFEGWFTDSDYSQAYNFDLAVKSDLTLYAKWSIIQNGDSTKCVVIFKNCDIAIQTIDKGQKVIKPSDPTKDNYKFEGWYEDANFTKVFDFNSVINKDTNIYAKWSEIPTQEPDDGNDDNENTPSKPTEDEIEVNKVLMENLSTAKTILNNCNLFGDAVTIRKYIIDVIDDVALKVGPNYDQCVLLNATIRKDYKDEINEANGLYDGLSEKARADFHKEVIDKAGDDYDTLKAFAYNFFGITLPDKTSN